jgi:hypothetical protein
MTKKSKNVSHETENFNTPLENRAFRPDVGTASVPEMHSNNAYLMAEDHIVIISGIKESKSLK